jgi:hypothetical protein
VSDGGELVVGWYDGEATVVEAWRRGQWEEVGRVRGRGAVGVKGTMVAVAGEGEVAVFDGGFDGYEEKWRVEVEGRGAVIGVEVMGQEVMVGYGDGLAIWPVEGGEGRAVGVEFVVNRLERVGRGEGLVLRLREREGEEIWVAVKRGGEWRVYFVPAGE